MQDWEDEIQFILSVNMANGARMDIQGFLPESWPNRKNYHVLHYDYMEIMNVDLECEDDEEIKRRDPDRNYWVVYTEGKMFLCNHIDLKKRKCVAPVLAITEVHMTFKLKFCLTKKHSSCFYFKQVTFDCGKDHKVRYGGSRGQGSPAMDLHS
jgi:hypothetical protein